MLEETKNRQESWDQAVKELRDRIPELYSAWTDYNLHDPGITILELFAWMQQAAGYRLRQIGEAHRKKYVKLLGMEMTGRRPGRTMVTVADRESRYLKEGSRFYAEDVCFETRTGQYVTEGIFRQFISRNKDQETVLQGKWLAEGKGLSLFPFGKRPKTGDSLELLLGRGLLPGGMHRLTVECARSCPVQVRPVEEEAFDGHGFYPLARLRMEYLEASGWREVMNFKDDTYGFMQDGSLCFELPSPMRAGDCRLRILLERCDYLLPPCITRISFAMAQVWQQETVERPPSFQGNGFPNQEFVLEAADLDLEQFCLEAEAAGAMEPWERVGDFDNSGPEDLHYTIDHGILRFGDGFHGWMPDGRIEIIHMVRTSGDMGNIKAGAIRRLEGETQMEVANEYDVSGGTREETIEEVLARYLKERELPARAVSWKDYERLVLGIPGLPIENCRVFGGEAGSRTVVIVVKPYTLDSCGVLNEAYKKNLYRYLEEKRLVGTRLEILSPEYYDVKISCVAAARVQYRQARELVEEAVESWIRKKGVGEGISYSELMGLIEAQPCVRKVVSLWLDTGSKGSRDQAGSLTLPPRGLIRLKQVTCQVMAAGDGKESR